MNALSKFSGLRFFLPIFAVVIVGAPLACAQDTRIRRPSLPGGTRYYRPYVPTSTPIATKNRTTWEAPTEADEKIKEEIQATQINHGVDSEEALKLIWKRAKEYYDGKHFAKAYKLLNQLKDLAKNQKKSAFPEDKATQMRTDCMRKIGLYGTPSYPSYTLPIPQPKKSIQPAQPYPQPVQYDDGTDWDADLRGPNKGFTARSADSTIGKNTGAKSTGAKSTGAKSTVPTNKPN